VTGELLNYVLGLLLFAIHGEETSSSQDLLLSFVATRLAWAQRRLLPPAYESSSFDPISSISNLF
jgi:hypothetical protein